MTDGNVKGFLRRIGSQEVPGGGGADGALGALIVSDDSTDLRFAGGKTAAVATVTASGDTTILTPSAGHKIKLYWITAINDPDQATNPLVRITLTGAGEIYRSYAIAHWEVFTGTTDGTLIVNLSEAASVAVTVHYEETT